MKAFIYFNLHKRLFSVKALEGANKGKVIAHVDRILVHDATFKVSEAGRQRVIREKRKNVHAGVVGYVLINNEYVVDSTAIDRIIINGSAITYNPYKYDSFVHLFGEHPISNARLVALNVTESRKPSIHTWN